MLHDDRMLKFADETPTVGAPASVEQAKLAAKARLDDRPASLVLRLRHEHASSAPFVNARFDYSRDRHIETMIIASCGKQVVLWSMTAVRAGSEAWLR